MLIVASSAERHVVHSATISNMTAASDVKSDCPCLLTLTTQPPHPPDSAAAAAAAVSLVDADDIFSSPNIDVTLYPTSTGHVNSAGQVQQFVTIVDVLRMSSVGPSLLLTPTQTLAVHPLPGLCDTEELPAARRTCGDGPAARRTGGDGPAARRTCGDGEVVQSDVLMPCCSVNALFTFPTHATQPLIGYECVAGQRVIGCFEYCDSPMTDVVCLQSPPLAATH